MNTETTKRNWTEVKGLIKARFGKLTDENIESVKPNLDLLSGKIQSVYGYAKEQAEREFKGFKATLGEGIDPGSTSNTPPKIEPTAPEMKVAYEPKSMPEAEVVSKPTSEGPKAPLSQDAKKVA